MGPVLLIHGGAGPVRPEARRAALRAALERIAGACFPALEAGASALETAVSAARALEDEPLFNAGLGSKLQRDGRARLSASLMDGAGERFSGVVNVEGLANPILLCRALLEERDRVLAGEGALARGRALGLAERDNRTPEAIAAWEAQRAGETGTIGAVALDRGGRLAAATSTGGRGFEGIGRVSDSCTVAGNFADGSLAVSCTGIGEHIVDGALAAGAALDEASAALTARMEARGWRAGLIAVDAGGRWAAPFTTEAMYWVAVDAGGLHAFR